jgi:cytoskeletal protein CcmA (bactofilin family)
MNTLLINKTGLPGNELIPDGPRLAIDPGVNAPSHVGTTVRIEGELYGQHDLLVDGEVVGTMMLPEHTLTIGAKARVKANIKAENVVLVGDVEGSIEAGKLIELRSCCSVVGDIRSPRIMIENGAYIKGAIEVTRQVPAHPVSQPPV